MNIDDIHFKAACNQFLEISVSCYQDTSNGLKGLHFINAFNILAVYIDQ